MTEIARTQEELSQAFAESRYRTRMLRRGFKVQYNLPQDSIISPDERSRYSSKHVVGIRVVFERLVPKASLSAYYTGTANSSQPLGSESSFLTTYTDFDKVAAEAPAAKYDPRVFPEMLKITTEVLERNGWQWQERTVPLSALVAFSAAGIGIAALIIGLIVFVAIGS